MVTGTGASSPVVEDSFRLSGQSKYQIQVQVGRVGLPFSLEIHENQGYHVQKMAVRPGLHPSAAEPKTWRPGQLQPIIVIYRTKQ